MSKATLANPIKIAIPIRFSGAAMLKSKHAPLPTITLAISVCLWLHLRSAHAASTGATTAEASIAAAKIHAQTTPPGTPQTFSANTIFST